MCEMTSMGEMSAARMTTPIGVVWAEVEGVDLRSALTTSFTPRFRVRCAAAVDSVDVSPHDVSPYVFLSFCC